MYWPSELRRSVTQPSRPRPSGPPQPVLSLVTSAVQGHAAVALTVQHSETIGRRKCSLPHPQSRPSASLSDQHLQVNKQCLMENPTQNEDKYLTHQRGGHLSRPYKTQQVLPTNRGDAERYRSILVTKLRYQAINDADS